MAARRTTYISSFSHEVVAKPGPSDGLRAALVRHRLRSPFASGAESPSRQASSRSRVRLCGTCRPRSAIETVRVANRARLANSACVNPAAIRKENSLWPNGTSPAVKHSRQSTPMTLAEPSGAGIVTWQWAHLTEPRRSSVNSERMD